MEIPQQIIFPKDLTDKDIELINKQCQIQDAMSKEQLEGFSQAYLTAKNTALDTEKLISLSPDDVENLILELGQLIEKRNEKGYRQVPVTFANGSKALDADKIPQAIQSFCQGFVVFIEDPAEDERLNTSMLYKNFEETHPFEDGNGRVGDLLWKMLEPRKRGQWPEKLPPNVFGEKR